MALPGDFRYSDDCHPDADDFARKNAGVMSDAEAEALAQHLLGCRDCLLAALTSLRDDDHKGVGSVKANHRSDTEENINYHSP